MRYVGLALCITAASIVFACGGSDSNGGNTPGATGGAAGETPIDNPPPAGGAPPTEGGTGNSMAGETSTPVGGEGGAFEPGVVSKAAPRPGNGNVVDGVVAHSSNFTMIFSVGEEPGGNISMSSSMHRVNLGVVGSTQK